MSLRISTLTQALALCVLSLSALTAQADAKQDLIKRLPTLQKAELDNLASGLAQTPALQIRGQAQQVLLQAVPPAKREATAKQVSAELNKYVDSATPVVKASVNKVAADAVIGVIEPKFSEEELKQLVTMLESPVIKKYQQALPEMMQALEEKVMTDARPQLAPQVQKLGENVSKILDTASGGKLSQAAADQAKAAGKK